MIKNYFKLVYSNGCVETVSCNLEDLDSLVFNRLDACRTLDISVVYISVYEVLDPCVISDHLVLGKYHFIKRFSVVL